MRLLRLLLPGLLLYALLLALGLILLGGNLLAALLNPLLPERLGKPFGRALISRCCRIFWWIAEASGMLRLDSDALASLRDEPGLIIAPNHPTMLDALILAARLPRSACIMKAALMHNIFLGAGARMARYIRNDSARCMLRSAVAELRDGGQLVIFPEGTRTTRPPVNHFTSAASFISKLAGTPIQTVLIDTDSPYLGKGWPIWRVPPLPVVFTIRLGERFAPATDTHAHQQRLERYFAAGLRGRVAAPAAQEVHPSGTRSA